MGTVRTMRQHEIREGRCYAGRKPYDRRKVLGLYPGLRKCGAHEEPHDVINARRLNGRVQVIYVVHAPGSTLVVWCGNAPVYPVRACSLAGFATWARLPAVSLLDVSGAVLGRDEVVG
jgi:hypothetical protein